MPVPAQLLRARKLAEEATENVQHEQTEEVPQEQVVTEDAPITQPEAENTVQEELSPNREDELSREIEKLNNKLRVLEGKYNAEVPVKAGEIRELKRENKELQDEINRLKDAVQAAKEEATIKQSESIKIQDEKYNSLFSEVLPMSADDRKTLDEYISRMIQQGIESGVNDRIKTVSQELETIKAASAVSAEERFLREVNDRIKNHQSILADPEFVEWINQKAPYSRNTRYELAIQAEKNLDADTYVEFFTDFENIKKSKSNKAADTLKPMPQKAATQSVAREPVKKVYSISEYQNGMHTYTILLRNRRASEAAKLKQELDAALKEGRVK